MRSRLKRFRKSDPSKIHGRHAYLGALLQRARDRTDRHGWHAVRRQVVKGHSRWFSELSPALREHFAGKAQEMRDERVRRRRLSIREEVARVGRLEKELQDQEREGRNLRMTQCAWSQAMQADFNEFCESDTWNPEHVQALRDESANPVQELPAALLFTLQQMQPPISQPKKSEAPDWLGWMCSNRAFFRGSVLKLTCSDEVAPKYVAFVFALQLPYLVCCMRLDPVANPAERAMAPAEFFGEPSVAATHAFQFTWTFAFSDRGLFDKVVELQVMTDSLYMGGGHLTCGGEWQSFHK